jgi:biotin synthase
MKIYLCAIANIESGTCNEDCKFCTQSVKYKADINRYKRKDISDIVREAELSFQNKAVGFCLVTAGKGLNDKRLEFVCKAAYAVKKAVPQLSLIACNGTATVEQLKELKNAGVDNYNHNLETSKEYYSKICTTHSWNERFETCLNIKKAGLNLCSGGIFGMGESETDRLSMLNSLQELNPVSIPLNFFHPNKALPLPNNTLDRQQAFDIIKSTRELLPNSMIMVAGGREITFGNEQYEIFKYGANSIVIGNYLTTEGKVAENDIKTILDLGYEIAKDCKR